MRAVVLISGALLVGCIQIEQPKYIERCLSSHIERRTELVPKVAALGHPSVGGMVLRTRTVTVCDLSETVLNPKYKEKQ